MAQEQKAPESEHIRKARRKLKKIMEAEAQEFSSERLEKMGEVMRQWLNRYAQERKPLTEKTIKLFDQNKHTAKTSSHYVKELRHKLKTSLGPALGEEEREKVTVGAMDKLKGRISRPEPKT